MSSNNAPLNADPPDLVSDFRNEVKDKRRGALIDAYMKKPGAETLSAKALELLAEDIDAIDKS